MKFAFVRLAWRHAVMAGLLAGLCVNAACAQGFAVQPWNGRPHPPAQVLTDLQGQPWRLADLRGKAVLINFWASWCEPCRAEMPSLQALAQRLGSQKMVVLTVNYKESPTMAAQFAQRTGLSLPVVADPQGNLARQWGIAVFPSTVLIGAEGRVRSVVRGEVDWGGADAAGLWQPLLLP